MIGMKGAEPGNAIYANSPLADPDEWGESRVERYSIVEVSLESNLILISYMI
jgi:hypothetical protein